MEWNKFTLKTTTNAVDIVSGMFIDLGIDGIEIEDNVPLSNEDKEKMYIDIIPELPLDDGTAYISFYIEESMDKSILEEIKIKLDFLREFVDIGDGTISISQTKDIDWINNWKKYFKPFTVDDIVIKPTWEKIALQDADKMIIEIDPGTAFGTGMHETTQLCIRQMKKYIQKEIKVLDVGCGSGILTILASKLGAKNIVSIDIDKNAVIATIENLEVNHIDLDKVKVIEGNILEDKDLQDNLGVKCYDVVVANILAPIIISLSEIITNHLKTGGIYITSGIIYDKKDAVLQAIKDTNKLEIIEITEQGDWVSVTARRI